MPHMTTYGAQVDKNWTGSDRNWVKMDWKLTGSGLEVEWKWAGSGLEVGRKWTGSGPEVGQKWTGN